MATLDYNSAGTAHTSHEALLQSAGIAPPSLLSTLTETDTELIREIVQVFLQQEPEQRRNIMRAILKRDRKLLKSTAHSMRGSLCIFGADEAILISERLETTAGIVDFGDAYDLFERLELELTKLSSFLGLLLVAH